MMESNEVRQANNSETKAANVGVLLTAKGLAAMLNVSARTIRRLVAAGRLIPPVKFGGSVRWRLDEVRDWIKSGCPRMREWLNQRGMS